MGKCLAYFSVEISHNHETFLLSLSINTQHIFCMFLFT